MTDPSILTGLPELPCLLSGAPLLGFQRFFI